MRLIDADALKPLTMWVTDDEGIDRPVVRLTDIDNEPTVCCEACEYGPPPADAVGARTACLHCYCGDNWKRRQP
jgi:hypothetical protein